MAPTWHRTALLVLSAASIGFGLVLCLLSCFYMFGVVGLQTNFISFWMEKCKKQDLDPTFKAPLLCTSLMDEIAAGVIGLLFGSVQIGIGAAMYITKEKPQLRKVWAAANAILLVFVLTAAILPLHVYSSYIGCTKLFRRSGGRWGSDPRESPPGPDRTEEECEFESNKYGNNECFRHWGCNQFSNSSANALVLIYGIFGILDAIVIFASVLILANMSQAASDSPGGYNPPGSAVEPMPSIHSQTASVPYAAHSQTTSSPSH